MLYDKLKNYSKSGIYPFHMPGHKRTDITEEGIIPYNIDITEIHDFDNLHSPNGVIDEIQKKAAKLYNAKNAFILINRRNTFCNPINDKSRRQNLNGS